MLTRPIFALALILIPITGTLSVAAKGAHEFPTTAVAQDIADVPPPPDLASEKMYLTNTETATFTGTVAQVRSFMDRNPITDFVATTPAIPAIEGIEVLSGTWPNPGAVRRVDLAGGYSAHERVLTNTDTSFTYQIWNITTPSGRAISHIWGAFTFAQSADAVDVTWDYNVKPSIFVARPAITRFLRDDFAPFMRAGLDGTVGAYHSQ